MPCVDLKDALEFVAGRVDPGLESTIETHLETCGTCRDLVLALGVPARVASEDGSRTIAAGDVPTPRLPAHAPTSATPTANDGKAEAPIVRGESVGRYTILEVVGRGAYGEVFAAYDPELDRKVAIKFLHGMMHGGSRGSEGRLLREAKAIAKVSHPNVVTVHDAGTFGDRVFVTMEFVDGATLKEWLRERPRSRAEILGVFKEAARGLAAAHAAGLVHRDFKPGNVMVGKDGRVLVMDFGLVRQVAGPEAELGDSGGAPRAEPSDGAGDPGQKPSSALSSEHELDLTRTGELIGTPAYMAPEQFSGDRTDARTDQFSFCVSLHAALYGQRPFAGDSFLTLRTNVLAQRVRPAPERPSVPTWLRRVLLRGLSVDAGARFPSMTALVDALDADPASRRRLGLPAAGLGAVGLVAALVVSRSHMRTLELCEGGGARTAGIWDAGGADSPRRRLVHEAFVRTGKTYAEGTFARTAALLDAYVDKWVATYRDACEATNVRAEQSRDVMSLRMACLDDRVRDLRALTDVYEHADDVVVHNAISAASALPALELCADVAALRAGQPFDDPATRTRENELRDRFARFQALVQSGQCTAAAAEGKPLLEDLRAAKSRPLLAETLELMGTLGDNCVDPRVAVEWLKEAYFTAEAVRLDRLAAEAAARIPVLAANRLGDAKMAKDWLELMRATLERVGPDDRLAALLLSAESLYAESQRDYGTQLETGRRALEMSRRALGPDHVQTLLQSGNVGAALENAGRDAEALVVYRDTEAAMVRALGPDHPSLANVTSNECEVLNHLGRYAEAEAACRRALDIWSAAGASPEMRSFARTALGISLLGLGRPTEAVPSLEEGLSDRLAGGMAASWVAETRFALARALWSRPAERARALALAKQARPDAGTAQATAAIDAWLAKPN